jgi:SAM-dependent methyltransferase
LELLIKHDRKAATELVRKATRLGGLEAQDFLSIAKSGIWKHYGPFRNSDDMFNGKDLLDVGARHGFHGIVFLAWGGRCYSATDLAKDSFTIKQLKNQRTLNHDKTPLPFSMKEIAQLNPDRINLTVGESEPSGGGPFDYITLFSVTEHLKPPAKVFAGLCNHLSPKGKIFVTHHNFYCWNGHHAGPKSIAQFTDMIGRGEETALADWAFFEKPLAASLNRLTVDQLRREVEHYFNIQNWRVDYTQLGKGLERLNPEILKKVMPLTIEDILTQSVHMLLECKGS